MTTLRAHETKFRTKHWLPALVLSLSFAACGDDGADKATGGAKPSEWSIYGHDYNNSRVNPAETVIGPTNVASLVEKWRFSETAVTGTPSLYDGKLYFGDWNAVFHAVDAKTGAELWRTQVQPATPPKQINNSAYVTDDTIYTGGEGAQLVALDRKTGAKKWDVIIDEQKSLMLWSSPIVVDGTLIIGIGSYQVFIPSNPPFQGSVVGVDIKTGAVKWRTKLTQFAGVSVWSSAAIDQTRKVAYIGSGQEYEGDTKYSDSLLAINYETGAIVWATQFTMGDRFQAGGEMGPDWDVGASPNLFDIAGRAVVGVGDKGGRYFVVDRDSGAIVWKVELTTGGANGGVMASTAYLNGVIYVASNDGSSGGEAGQGGGPGKGSVFALNAVDGTIKWKIDVAPGVFGALSIANGVLYMPSLAGEARAYDINDGKLLWAGTSKAPGKDAMSMGGGVVVSDGMVYAGYGWTWTPIFPVPGGLIAWGPP